MSKALDTYINNIKNAGLNVSEKEMVITIDSGTKNARVINILKYVQSVDDTKTSNCVNLDSLYKVTVKLYMTKPDSINFTFHTTWNNGIAMPLRVMYGKIIEQTKNMYKMQLQGKITKTDVCLKCGKPLTNEISKLYGLGPECGQHYYINPLTKEEFENYKKSIQDKFSNITWEGWIPKVSIISLEEVDGKVN